MQAPRLLLGALALSFLAAGIADAFVPLLPGRQYSAVDMLHMPLITALCYAWCRADLLARGQVPRGRIALFAGVFPLLGVPVFFLRTRPWRQALLGLLRTVGFLAACLLLASLGGLLGEFAAGASHRGG
ncbi:MULTISPECIES: rard protein [Variovorax]|uniref:rard protein n=1 Tax=Variovorax paradoxus TaxID=34073 RepID=UPI00193410D2|nr:rard protein [Variovorax paradoxus]